MIPVLSRDKKCISVATTCHGKSTLTFKMKQDLLMTSYILVEVSLTENVQNLQFLIIQ